MAVVSAESVSAIACFSPSSPHSPRVSTWKLSVQNKDYSFADIFSPIDGELDLVVRIVSLSGNVVDGSIIPDCSRIDADFFSIIPKSKIEYLTLKGDFLPKFSSFYCSNVSVLDASCLENVENLTRIHTSIDVEVISFDISKFPSLELVWIEKNCDQWGEMLLESGFCKTAENQYERANLI